METWNQRLDQAILFREEKNKRIADYVGVSGATVSDWRKGIIKTIEGENLLKVSNFLKIRPEWLVWGKKPSGLDSGDSPIQEESTNQKSEHEVPVLTWPQVASLPEKFSAADIVNSEQWLHCPVSHGPRTFAAKISGDSMWPTYPDESDIFVDPDIPAQHNDDVIIISSDGIAALKRLKITNEGPFIEAINPNWPNRINNLPETSKICGAVIYSGKSRR